ncbi:hypothetical protein [Methylococcus sp. Mc7]|uniref:hypothetical protein n=1 Tax=Methylococcus sp. Mc7 TaxID=2860258 RepID=UPI001C52FBAC|nr:hypothetical protein [Methylococcus sp. Mc7]QXP83009.1 hypothetical protein KW115_12470 [Methylococcus sp. Mc7]
MTHDPSRDRIDGDRAKSEATANVLAQLTRAGVTGVTEEQIDILVRIEMMGLIAKQSAGQQQAEAIQ